MELLSQILCLSLLISGTVKYWETMLHLLGRFSNCDKKISRDLAWTRKVNLYSEMRTQFNL